MTDRESTVFVVDDDPAVLKALARLLESADLAVRTFPSSREFLRAYDPSARGCLLLDVEMPDLDGLALQQALASSGGGPPVVFLTGRGDIPMSVQAMKRGAVDFLTKPVEDGALIDAVKAALAEDRAGHTARAEAHEIRRRLGTLTPREREVLGHVVKGRLNKQIAADLGTVEKTVKVHRARMMRKMQVRSVAELVRLVERTEPAARE